VRRDLVVPLAQARDHAEAVREQARRQIEEADEALAQAVTRTWLRGFSWQAIGTILGISRQAAAKRYGAHVAEALRERGD
jgi:DNA-directed RNA polymerase specialized sigma24 family protein